MPPRRAGGWLDLPASGARGRDWVGSARPNEPGADLFAASFPAGFPELAHELMKDLFPARGSDAWSLGRAFGWFLRCHYFHCAG